MKTTRKREVVVMVVCIYLSIAAISPRWSQQSDGLITGAGEYCTNIEGIWTSQWSITFPPAGGVVTGSFYREGQVTKGGITTTGITTGTLNGVFTGGDGGYISGTLTGQVVADHLHEDGSITHSTNNISGTWDGYLRADGTGDGFWNIGQGNTCTWNVVYSPVEFQAALQDGAPIPTSAVTVSEIPLEPIARDFINAALPLDQATASIINQDTVIIARDAANDFYAVSNQGQSTWLPQELSSVYQVSNTFAILGNDALLASSEHGSIRGSINGGGDFVYLNKIPSELKTRDYAMLTTSCSPTGCRPEMKINSTASSIFLLGGAMGADPEQQCDLPSSTTGVYDASLHLSSEHSSVRGTINGGG